MSIVQEMFEKEEIKLSRVKNSEQLAGILTKDGSLSTTLLKKLQEEHFQKNLKKLRELNLLKPFQFRIASISSSMSV